MASADGARVVEADADGVHHVATEWAPPQEMQPTAMTAPTPPSPARRADRPAEESQIHANANVVGRMKAMGGDFRKHGSLLFHALEDGDGGRGAAEALLDAGYDVNQKHFNFETPLHFCIRTGNMEWVIKLLDAGADPKLLGPSGYSALHYAGHFNRPQIASVLIQRGIDLEFVNRSTQQTALFVAARAGATDVVGILLQHGANTATCDFNLQYTPLHVAARHNRTEVIELLLETGADPNSKDAEGYTPLMLAAQHGHAAAAAKLAESAAVRTDVRMGLLSWVGGGWDAADLADAKGHADVAAEIRRLGATGPFA